MSFSRTGLACVIAMAFSLPAGAATLYVDSIFGDNDGGLNTDCRKKTPCRSIQHAIDQGGANARIILAPGSYMGPITVIEDNVKITSVAGALATEILGDDPDADAIVTVTADRFTLGGKGKGVSIGRDFAADDPEDQSGIIVQGNKARIEGNILNGDDFGFGPAPDIYDLTGHAVVVEGTGATIRFNQIQSWNDGILVDSPDVPAKSMISGNDINGIGGNCIEVESGDRSSDKVESNVVNFCNYDFGEPRDGIVLNYAGLEINSKPRVQKNIIQGVRNGIEIHNAAPNVTRNLVRWTGRDTDDNPEDGSGILLLSSVKGKVTNNLTTGTENALFLDADSTGNTATGNTLIFTTVGVKIDSTTGNSPLKNFSKNNIDAFDCPVQTEEPDYSFEPIVMKQNFWYGYRDADNDNVPILTGPGCENSDNAKGNGSLTFPASRAEPNVVKFKSPI